MYERPRGRLGLWGDAVMWGTLRASAGSAGSKPSVLALLLSHLLIKVSRHGALRRGVHAESRLELVGHRAGVGRAKVGLRACAG